MLDRLFDVPSSRPTRQSHFVSNSRKTSGKSPHRISSFIVPPNIPVCGKGQIHGPDKYRTVALLPTLVETHVAPHASADKHKPDFLIARSCVTGLRPCTNFLEYGLCRVAPPDRAAM